jgi:DnaJ-class molecular chaperone
MPVPRSRKRDTKLYDFLEVSPDATSAQIAKAYKVAAMKYHPDRNPDAPPEKFKEISAAYDVLKDEHKKEIYDQYGLEGLKEGMGAESNGATSLFDLLMGGPTRHNRRHGQPKGESKVIPLKVSLETLYNGETKSVSFTRKIVCKQCNGSGCREGKKRIHCRACHGQGIRMGMTRMGPLTFQQPVQCRECDGEGEIIAHKDKCNMCHGNKISEERKNLDVVILPGYSNGKKIKFRGENDQLPGIEAGDVYILIEQEQHPIFERINENDLLIKMKINLNESLTGFKRTIQHLDGRYVLIQHPPDQPITQDSMKKIPNQGMISMETHHTGDLITHFDVEFPPMNFFNDPNVLQKLESLLPSKPVLNIPSGINLDEASPMICHKQESHSNKHCSHITADDSNEDDDDQYMDDDDDDGQPQVHSCPTH